MADENLFFLSLLFDENGIWFYVKFAFYKHLQRYVEEHQLSFTTRASFGVSNTNRSQISPLLTQDKNRGSDRSPGLRLSTTL